MKAVRIRRLAAALWRDTGTPIRTIGIRPGERLHDILISKDEVPYLKNCPAGGFLLSAQDRHPAWKIEGGSAPRSPTHFRDMSSTDAELEMTDDELITLRDGALVSYRSPTKGGGEPAASRRAG
jgi:hypothetical protein